MGGKKYGIYESVGSTRETVTDYGDLSNHHPSKHFKEKGRAYETVDGYKEEVVHRGGQTLVSKDFVLYDPTGVKGLGNISESAKQMPVPSPFAGLVEVNKGDALLQIRDPESGELLAQIRHMKDFSVKTGDTVEYGQALGTQSSQKTKAVHTHIDLNTKHIPEFDQYLKDISSGAITTGGYHPTQDAAAQQFQEQLGDRLTGMGMSCSQVDTLAAAASKESLRYPNQGSLENFLLSKDAQMVGMQFECAPLREFGVAQALAKDADTHKQEATQISISRETGVTQVTTESIVPQAPAR